MPWPSAPSVTAASPETPRHARELARLLELRHRGDQVERCADRTLGVVLVRDRDAPDGHDGVADELLDRAAVALHTLTAEVVVAGQQLAGVLGVARLRDAREADEVAEEHRDEAPLGDRLVRCGLRASECPNGSSRATVDARCVAHSEQNLSPGWFDDPQLGQPTASAYRTSAQNLRPDRFSVPQVAQITRRSTSATATWSRQPSSALVLSRAAQRPLEPLAHGSATSGAASSRRPSATSHSACSSRATAR